MTSRLLLASVLKQFVCIATLSAGMTDREFSYVVGIAPCTLSRICTGVVSPRLDSVYRILCTAYDLVQPTERLALDSMALSLIGARVRDLRACAYFTGISSRFGVSSPNRSADVVSKRRCTQASTHDVPSDGVTGTCPG